MKPMSEVTFLGIVTVAASAALLGFYYLGVYLDAIVTPLLGR